MDPVPNSATIGIVGAGTMGAGIAQIAAHAGHSILLYDTAAGAAKRGIDRIGNDLNRLVEKNKMDVQARDELLARIKPVHNLGAFAPASLVIEAIAEDLDTKQQLFNQLENICGDNTILASNTSSLSITAISANLKRPRNIIGMHFFNPAPVMKLVEIISGLNTDRSTADIAFATAAAWGKSPVHAKSTPGFIVNRVARPFYGEALRILQEGYADPATIDALMRESGGFRMGPFELMDLIGHDVNYAVTESVFKAYFNDPRYQPSLIQQELVTAGCLGRKSGRGFFEYQENSERPKPASADPVPAAREIVIKGHLGAAEPLFQLLRKARLQVWRQDNGPGVLRVGSANLALSDGRTATERSASEDLDNLILFDLSLDYHKATRIALAPADQAAPSAVKAATGLFQALDKQVSIIDDCPGMVVLRTVCMLANEGADAVHQRICDARAIDIAMQGGVNYPCGPLAWADTIGLNHVLAVLDNLSRNYGEDRYRASPLLRRKVYNGGKLRD